MPNTDIKALIAEARRYPNPDGVKPARAPGRLIADLVDALEAALHGDRRYACCACCASGVDPELHAENGRDFHDVPCETCDRIATRQSETRAHDAQVIDGLADKMPIDLWSTFGQVPREALLKIQEWVHDYAARIRRGGGN